MTTAVRPHHARHEELDAAIERACARIAPAWPLDQSIAVNPFWGFIEQPLPRAAARIAALTGSRLLMPRAWFREQWRAGRLRQHHLAAAVEHRGGAETVARLTSVLATDAPPPPRGEFVTDLADRGRDLRHGMAWHDYVVHAVSQSCAAYFDAGQARLTPPRDGGLYAQWHHAACRDHGPRLLMGLRGHRERLRRLPAEPRPLIAAALAALAVPAPQVERYLTALLLDLNGWASWCAWLRWQARFGGGDDPHLVELLAVRLAWEWLLHDSLDAGLRADWRAAMARWPLAEQAAAVALEADWLLQEAAEIAWREPLCTALAGRAATPSARPAGPPPVQAAFCIDVRSEVFRRALESVAPAAQTLGFAGFFGLPIEYRPLGARDARPQLPGLLAPALCATDAAGIDELATRRRARLERAADWRHFRGDALSGFTFVESLGLAYAGRLARAALGHAAAERAPERAGLTRAEDAARRPRLASAVNGAGLTVAARAELAAGMLTAMGLTRDFARLVLLAGHGSRTANNPQAAALDCGACGGQTGEVNARVAAALLNDTDVRAALRDRGIVIADDTRFIAGLHETTTDQVTLFDLEEWPASHAPDLERLRDWLGRAGERARRERAPALGLAELDDATLREAVVARSRDWAEVRPEWGLAGNAAFVVAPRERTQGLDLGGRAFLHDYRWQDDRDFAVLELIMTAPMLVTHWINLHYYASTVDNRRWGSGNKVLHNVVGGRLGVFEGNGGDLRVGLSLQSLHDGERWMHEPLRLSVFIEAPAAAIDAVLARHATVRHLVENGWLHLLRIDAEAGVVEARRADRWVEVARAGPNRASAPGPALAVLRSERGQTRVGQGLP